MKIKSKIVKKVNTFYISKIVIKNIKSDKKFIYKIVIKKYSDKLAVQKSSIANKSSKNQQLLNTSNTLSQQHIFHH